MTPYEIISRKRDRKELSREQIEFLINGVTDQSIPDYQLAAWLMAVYLNGMSPSEKHFLTQAMLHSGKVIDLKEIPGIKVDKHSTGGVGDKVSIILAPIVAAAGVSVPMISGRGLGHTGGTLDKLQSIPGFKVDYNTAEYKKIIAETGVCLIGQTKDIAPADKKIYALRDVTATVQSIPLISASIMSKKLAEGIDALVLDVKTGHGAFMQEYAQAIELAKSLIEIGEAAGKQTVAYITNMNQPLGNTVGNWLEVKECIDCLQGNGPDDLMEVTHRLCGAMIWLGKKAESIEQGVEISQKMISSGKAWDKFLQIVERQQGSVEMVKNPQNYPRAKHQLEIKSEKDGYLSAINSLEIGLASVGLGAGRLKWEDNIDPKAGIILNRKQGAVIKKNDTIMTLYSDNMKALNETSVSLLEKSIQITHQKPDPEPLIITYLDKNNLS